MFININKKKGFSLVELIVVMGVMALLVLVGVPKFLGHTKQSNLTKIKASIKEVESAADRYYLKNEEWPRATEKDDYYTKEELESYAKEIYDKTGVKITLDSEGKYYDVNFVSLNSYIKIPDKNYKYIIQNPVGQIYYLDKLSPEGEKIFNPDYKDTKPSNPGDVKPEEPIIPSPEIEYSPEDWFIITAEGAVNASDTLKSLPGPININIPKTINGIIPSSIAASGFYGMKNLGSVIMPDTITSIATDGFRTTSINSIKLSEGLLTIGTQAFDNNQYITSIVIPDSVKSIGNYAFESNMKLSSIILSQSLTNLGNRAFLNCTSLKEIRLPESLNKINIECFKGWTSSQTIIFEKRNNKTITLEDSWNGSAKVDFENQLDFIICDESGAVYANPAFIKVSGDFDLVISEKINGITVKSLGNYAFSSHKNIKSLSMPDTVISIGSYAFKSSSIKTINLSTNLSTIGSYAFNASSITTLEIHDKVTAIGSYAFENAKSLTSIKLSNSLITLGNRAFQKATNLSIIQIPKSVTKINIECFYGWTSAQTIQFIDRISTSGITLGDSWKGSATIIYQL